MNTFVPKLRSYSRPNSNDSDITAWDSQQFEFDLFYVFNQHLFLKKDEKHTACTSTYVWIGALVTQLTCTVLHAH